MAAGVLTEAQEILCVEIAKGRTQYDAYRAAFPKTRANRNTIDREVAKLLKRSQIRTRIIELQAKGTEKAAAAVSVSKQDIMRELWENARIGKAAVPVLDREGAEIGVYNTNLSASNAALIALGKEIGMFKEAAQEADPLDGLTHEQVKQVKAILSDLVVGDDSGNAIAVPRGRRKKRATH